jgi:hypothetical protein
VEALLHNAKQASAKQSRPKSEHKGKDWDGTFGVNRFRKDQLAIFVLSSFWRLMAAFTAINVSMRILGVMQKHERSGQLAEGAPCGFGG